MIGERIGRYEVLRHLGSGGMGSVWLAHDPLLHRDVAIKLLAEHLEQRPKERQRFLREARAAALLDHPGVAAIHEVGEWNGRAYIAMAWIDGENLEARLGRGPLALEEAIHVGCAAADALGHAHARGVIHRDVTSRNTMLARDGRVMLVDFGLAIAAHQSRLTSSSTAVLGTLPYVAPEVLSHDDPTPDPRSDVYSLGVVVYEALTGERPFRAERPESLIYRILNEAPQAPSARRPEIGPTLDAAVLRALAKQPEERFDRAEEFATALRSALGTTMRSTPSPHVAMRASGKAVVAFQPFRELGGAAAPLTDGWSEAIAARIVSLPEIEVVTLPPELDAAAASERALAAGAARLLRGSVRIDGARLRLSYTLADVGRGAQIAGDSLDGTVATLFELEDRLVDSLARALGVAKSAGTVARPADAAAHERYLQSLGYLQRIDDEAAIDAAVRLLEELAAAEPESARIHAGLARAYVRQYQLRWERSLETRAAAACQRAMELEPEAPEVLVTLGELHNSTGRHAEAIAAFERALALTAELPDAWLGIAVANERLGRYDDAEEACRRAIALRPADWTGYDRLGLVCYRQGRFAQALEPWLEAARLAPNNPRVHQHLGAAYFRLDRYDDAIAAYRRSIDARPGAVAWSGLGTVLYYRARYDEAAEAFEKCTALKPLEPWWWGNLASALARVEGRQADRFGALDRAIALTLERLDVNPNHGEDWMRLASWQADRERPHEARRAMERARALAPEDVSVMADAGIVHDALGNRDEALRLLEEAVRRGYGIQRLLHHPSLEGLRADPRFQRIIDLRPE